MFSKGLNDVLNYIRELKARERFEIIDVHMHPMDVMGVVHSLDHHPNSHNKNNSSNWMRKGILEFFHYGSIVNIVSPLYYKLFPSSVHHIIRDTYTSNDENRILDEMNAALIDEAFLVPIDPWVSLEQILKFYRSERFYFLYSPDIHNKSAHELQDEIVEFRKKGAIGIKLHPNLQDFYPQPSHNPNMIKFKLETIYKTAEEQKMVLLFHGGKSFFTKDVNSRYQQKRRARDKGLLKNFINADNTSEIFSNYKIPVVIAHLGNFGLIIKDMRSLKRIAVNYSNVYFDTSGCSPRLIKAAINIIGSQKIIFGSDGIYNRMAYGIYFVYLATRELSDEKSEDAIINIFSKNIQGILKQLK